MIDLPMVYNVKVKKKVISKRDFFFKYPEC